MTGYYGIVHKFLDNIFYAVLSSSSGNDALQTAVDSGISPDAIVDIRYLDSPEWDIFGYSQSENLETMTQYLFDGNTLTVNYLGLPYSMRVVDPNNISSFKVEFFNKTNNIPISYIDLTGVDSHFIFDVLDVAVLLYHVELLDTLEQLQYGHVTLH